MFFSTPGTFPSAELSTRVYINPFEQQLTGTVYPAPSQRPASRFRVSAGFRV